MVKVNCKVCNKEQNIKESRASSYKTCSYICAARYRKSQTIKNYNKCNVCGNSYQVKKSHTDIRKTCSKECHYKYMTDKMSGEKNPMYGIRGASHPSWKNGKRISKYGYVLVYDHSNENKTRKSDAYHFEHRKIMEDHLGRSLKRSEIIHHKNGNKTDNRIENLEITTLEDHSRHHYGEKNIKRDPCTGRYCAGHFNIVTEFEQSSRVEGAFGSTGL